MLTSRYKFEEGIAASHVSKEVILKEFGCDDLCKLLYGKVFGADIDSKKRLLMSYGYDKAAQPVAHKYTN